MRAFVAVTVLVGWSGCALDSGGGGVSGSGVSGSGVSGTGDGGSGMTSDGGGSVVDLGTCIGSVPVTARVSLGTACAPCLCANEVSRPSLLACEADCWALVVCATTRCSQASPDFLNCVTSNCGTVLGALSTAQPIGPLVTACDAQCNSL